MPPSEIDGRVTPGSPRSHAFLLALSVVLLVGAWFVVWPYRAAVVFALLVGYLLYPAYRWLRPRVRWEGLAAGILLLGVAVALVLPFIILTTLFLEDALSFARQIAGGGDPLQDMLRNFLVSLGLPPASVDPVISQASDRLVSALESALVPALTSLVDFIIGLIVFFVLLYFVLTDGAALMGFVRDVIPLDRARADRLLDSMGNRARAVVVGSFLIALVQGALAGLGWWILGLPAPVLWGAVMVVLEIVPVVGAFIVLVPAAVWAYTQGRTFAAVGLIVLNFVLVGLVDDVLRPWAIGKAGSINPALVLIGIVGGLVVFGLAGIIIGPIILSLLKPVLEAWSEPRRGYLADAEETGDAA